MILSEADWPEGAAKRNDTERGRLASKTRPLAKISNVGQVRGRRWSGTKQFQAICQLLMQFGYLGISREFRRGFVNYAIMV
jgi:hypothetical protein